MSTDANVQQITPHQQRMVEEAYLDDLLGSVTEDTNNIAVKLSSKVRTQQEESQAKAVIIDNQRALQKQAKADREEVKRAEADKAEAKRAEAKRAEAKRAEAKRIEADKAEAQTVEAEKVEIERAEAERVEAERAEAETVEAETVEAETVEAETVEAETAKVNRVEAERSEILRDQVAVVESAKNLDAAQQDDKTLPFMCQLFTLLGLKLALPLSTFSRVLPWPDDLLPVSDAAEHVVGKLHDKQHDYEVVDVSGLIMPARKQESLTNMVTKNYSCIILLMDGRTGIACENCGDTVMVKPELVSWRSSQSLRSWLAGTVKKDGYALLDIDGIMSLLS